MGTSKAKTSLDHSGQATNMVSHVVHSASSTCATEPPREDISSRTILLPQMAKSPELQRYPVVSGATIPQFATRDEPTFVQPASLSRINPLVVYTPTRPPRLYAPTLALNNTNLSPPGYKRKPYKSVLLCTVCGRQRCRGGRRCARIARVREKQMHGIHAMSRSKGAPRKATLSKRKRKTRAKSKSKGASRKATAASREMQGIGWNRLVMAIRRSSVRRS